MGERGPVGKRANQRLGHGSKASKTVTKQATPARVRVPPAAKGWHPIARRWYQSLAASGQSTWYTAGDWMTAYAVAESMSREFKPQVVGRDAEGAPVWAEVPPRAAALVAWRAFVAALLVTEGDRRRVHVELERSKPQEEAGEVAWLADARSRLAAGGD